MPAFRLVALALAASALTCSVPVQAGDFHISPVGSLVMVDDEGCSLKMRIRDDGSTWKIQADGCFEVSDDESDIVQLPSGGWFRAEERRRGRTAHAIEIRRPGSGDALVRTYRRDGRVAPFDDEARVWMSRALRVVFQHSDFGRDAHIERVLAREGLDAALREIAAVDSDYQARMSYLRLLALRPGDATVLERAAADAAGRIDSSYEMAELLVALAESPGATPATLAVAARAATDIDSDYERRKALAAIVSSPARDADVVAAVLGAMKHFDSDHERGVLLRQIAAGWPLEGAMGIAYFDAVVDMNSDYERAKALQAVIDRTSIAPDVAGGLAAAAAAIDSDYHKAEVLEALLSGHELDESARQACLRAAETIDSDYHRRRVLDALHAKGS
jgi:hypothetical protein